MMTTTMIMMTTDDHDDHDDDHDDHEEMENTNGFIGNSNGEAEVAQLDFFCW